MLRQYDEADVRRRVAAAVRAARAAEPGDGLARRAAGRGDLRRDRARHVWVALGPEGPRTVTFAARLSSLERPSDLAERLPKALIHPMCRASRCTPSCATSYRAWAAAAPYAAYGARQRWIRTVRDLTADWPVADGPGRWRQGEVTVRWEATGAARVTPAPWRRGPGTISVSRSSPRRDGRRAGRDGPGRRRTGVDGWYSLCRFARRHGSIPWATVCY
ncbi:hypothetical protein GCM10023238_24150 [Streptomyces heliomycini]